MKLQWAKKNESQYFYISKYFSPFFDLEKYLSDSTLYCCEVRDRNELAAVSIVRFRAASKRVTLLYTLVGCEYRQKGLNGRIKTAVEHFASEKGANHLWGHVRENNKASLQCLLKNGYYLVNKGEKYYKNGDRKLTVMKKIPST